MTKKTTTRKKRRQSTPNVPVYTVPTTSGASVSPVKPSADSTLSSDMPATAAGAVDWQGEYGYVLSDLRNMLIVSAAMVVLLLVLNFFIA